MAAQGTIDTPVKAAPITWSLEQYKSLIANNSYAYALTKVRQRVGLFHNTWEDHAINNLLFATEADMKAWVQNNDWGQDKDYSVEFAYLQVEWYWQKIDLHTLPKATVGVLCADKKYEMYGFCGQNAENPDLFGKILDLPTTGNGSDTGTTSTFSKYIVYIVAALFIIIGLLFILKMLKGRKKA